MHFEPISRKNRAEKLKPLNGQYKQKEFELPQIEVPDTKKN